MSIASEISRIQQAKADIKTAIEAKGVIVPSSATIDTYDDYVSQISGGGEESWIEIKDVSGTTITEAKNYIGSVNIPNGVTSISNSAFTYCTSLSSVTIPNSVTSIGNGAFSDCTSLLNITFPSGLTSIGTSLFSGCTSLSSLTIPDSVTSIDNYAFKACSGLTSINIPSGLTSLGTAAFSGCTSLLNVTIPDSITTINNYTFAYCKSLSSATIPDSVTNIHSNAFYNVGTTNSFFDISNINLTNVTASANFNSIFYNSYVKGNMTIPNNLLSGATSGYSSTCMALFAYSYCRESLNIDVYADGRIIPRNMFFFYQNYDNSDGLNLVIHGTPTYLSSSSICCSSGGSVTFADCTVPPNSPSYGTSSSSPFYNFKGTLYVPSDGLSAWKSKYTGIASQIQAIPTYQWVSYQNGDTVPTTTTVYGAKIYMNYDEDYNIIFSGTTGDYIRFYPNGNFGQWSAEDENGNPININSYFDGYEGVYTILFSDLGMGGMNIISPSTTFEDNIELYEIQ